MTKDKSTAKTPASSYTLVIAVSFVIAVLMFLGVNDGNLEEGSFRCDANVSVRPKGSQAFGTRCEIKNVNSFRFVQRAIEYEVADQVAKVSQGIKVRQFTKQWNESLGKTIEMR